MHVIEEIKNRINIVELATQLGLQPTNNDQIFSIYKNEKNRSLKLYRKTNSFYCFATGKGGDLINFYSDFKKIENRKAIALLAKELGLDNGKEEKKEVYSATIKDPDRQIEPRRSVDIYQSLEKYCNGVDEKTREYLIGPKRGLTEEIISRFRLFSIKSVNGSIDYMINSFHLDELKAAGLFNEDGRFVFTKHKLIIPYLEGNEIIYLRGRVLPEDENENIGKYIGLAGQKAKRFFNHHIMKSLKDNAELLLCEGEFDTIRVAQEGYPAIGVPGVNNFPENGKKLLEKFKLHICFDNDEPGEKGMQDVTDNIGKVIKGLFLKMHKDLTEHLNNNGTAHLLNDENIEVRELRPIIKRKSKFKLLTAREILNIDFPNIECVVKELIPVGLTILAGRPKIGKSWLALNISIAVANGTNALGGFETKKSKVLYIALEDSKRRIKDRINNIMGNEIDKLAPEGLIYLEENFDFPKINDGGIQEINNILDDEKDIELVVIDTLGRSIADKGRKDRNIYLADYEIASQLQELAMKRNISILILHHTKKGNEENVFDEISGTTGLTGAMDTMMVIKEKNKEHTLHITGRDVEQADYKIVFDKKLFCWNVIEKKNEINITAEREEILELIKSYNRQMKLSEITDLIGKEKSNVNKLLKKLIRDGLLISPKYGYYALPEKIDDKDEDKDGMFD